MSNIVLCYTRWERSCSWLKNIMQTNWPCYLYKSHISIQHFIFGHHHDCVKPVWWFSNVYIWTCGVEHMYIYITKNLYSFSSHSIYIYMTRARIKAILYLQYWIYKFWCAVDERSRRLVQARVCHPQAVDQKTTCCFFVWQLCGLVYKHLRATFRFVRRTNTARERC